MTINLNARIKVKLTELGKDIYRRSFTSINEKYRRPVFKPSECEPKIDTDGFTEFSLWDFIHTFGEAIYLGAPNVIEPIEIEVVERE